MNGAGNANLYFENAVILLGKDACIEDEDQAVMQKELEAFAYVRHRAMKEEWMGVGMGSGEGMAEGRRSWVLYPA